MHKPRIQRFNDRRCLLFSLQSPTTTLSLANKTERNYQLLYRHKIANL